jgi:hypothetical protein
MFFSIVIIVIVNLIIFNLSVQVLIYFNLFLKKNVWFFFDGNNFFSNLLMITINNNNNNNS